MDNPFSFSSAEDSSGFLLWRTHNYWQREIRRCLKVFDLTHTQFVILAGTHWLTMKHEEVTQIEVAEHTKTDVMLTSNVLRALEKQGLIARAEHSKDIRAKKVFLTESGYSTLEKAVKVVEKFDRDFFSKLQNQAAFNAELISLIQDY